MTSKLPKIVTGAELGEMFNLSERSIREHRAKGNVFRLGDGYDFPRSVRGMIDHQRIEDAKKGHGELGEPLWKSYAAVLRYRAAVSDERGRLREAIDAILALPDLPAAVRLLASGIPPAFPEDEEG